MADPFDKQLAKVNGKIRRINMANFFERKRDGLLYYWNHAEKLNRSALIIWESGHPLQEIFAMLAGLSLELLLKGILRGLKESIPHHHKLIDLSNEAGITICDDDKIILQALTEYVTWASKYPAPKDEDGMSRAMEIFDKQRRKSGNLSQIHISEREINRDNYVRLWGLFAGHFIRVQGTVFESVEFLPSQ